MKLGFGLYRHMLTEDYFRFARQCGATHLIVHLRIITAAATAASSPRRTNTRTTASVRRSTPSGKRKNRARW